MISRASAAGPAVEASTPTRGEYSLVFEVLSAPKFFFDHKSAWNGCGPSTHCRGLKITLLHYYNLVFVYNTPVGPNKPMENSTAHAALLSG